ncbi:MAG: division/cell wall cluster transcriptional repressor MraZ [Succinivibrionaceae bacterium]|nr:division/cell wall cluster transcriptional repressor MraZ [Succinivibrionaceae bacterium]
MANDLMLSGVSEISLDDKGRLGLPARHRQTLRDNGDKGIVITKSIFDACLWIYPASVWVGVSRSLGGLPSNDPFNRSMQRIMMGGAVELDLDGQGRILVPAPLREFAGIRRGAVLLGLNRKFELWSAEAYAAREQEDLKMLREGAGSMGSGAAGLVL